MKSYWFLRRGENRSTRRKTFRSRVEEQQTQPTYDAGFGYQTRATLVGGECSHHCTIPAPKVALILKAYIFSVTWYKKVMQSHFVVYHGLFACWLYFLGISTLNVGGGVICHVTQCSQNGKYAVLGAASRIARMILRFLICIIF